MSNSVIKVPIGGIWRGDSLPPIPSPASRSSAAYGKRVIKVNTTLIFNTTQAFWAANAGADLCRRPVPGTPTPTMGIRTTRSNVLPGNSLYWVEDHKNFQGRPEHAQ